MENLDQLGVLIAETARAWRLKLDQRLAPLGLSQAQWLVLVHLNLSPPRLVQKDLAHRMGIEGPTLVRLLDRMAENGWIERRPSETDRRSKIVVLTAKSSDVLDRIQEIAGELRRELLEGVPSKDLKHCFRTLQRIKERAENSTSVPS